MMYLARNCFRRGVPGTACRIKNKSRQLFERLLEIKNLFMGTGLIVQNGFEPPGSRKGWITGYAGCLCDVAADGYK